MFHKRILFPFFILILIGFCLSACRSQYAATEKIYKGQAKEFAKLISTTPPTNQAFDSLQVEQKQWIGSVNFGIRRPNFVIIHHTAQDSLAQTIHTFHLPRTQVSAHYVIGRNGEVVQMVNDYLRAQHAGIGKWGKDTDLNSSSIGIELDNNGHEPWSDIQIENLIKLLAILKEKYKIPEANFIGHSDIAPKRKPDPANFPWDRLAQEGFGYWYDDLDSLVMPPEGFDPEVALSLIGYDTSDINAAIVAFKRHFIQDDIEPVLTERDLKILYNIYPKYK
ncbi:N-acetylmuramoyl-L-alanine amidase [Olivibacter sitiensis]|uniref:N-acetylmuramoyl-L-alanine amidase n=1 Tax=Olivibacter sitiensis TaxID=376470 RepID=UPI00040E2723|nr:N-acetylmuramoyl-L-alanine amidase [Olivibacter sitiensis]